MSSTCQKAPAPMKGDPAGKWQALLARASSAHKEKCERCKDKPPGWIQVRCIPTVHADALAIADAEGGLDGDS